MDNHAIAAVLQEIGDILEIKGENRFKVLAYQKAAQTLGDLGEDLRDIYTKDPKDLEKISGIGRDLAAKIGELIETGKCTYHEKLLKNFPQGLLEMLRVRTMGPKKVKLFYGELGVDSVEKLKKAAEAGKLRELPRMGEKSEQEILKAIEEFGKYQERMLLAEALEQVAQVMAYMKTCTLVKKIEFAGSCRRMKETVGDLDVLVTSKKDEKVHKKIMDHFAQYKEVDNVIAQGPTKSSVILTSGVQVDLRVIDEESFGAALHYFTGSKEHNVMLRDRAKHMGLRINEYGVYKLKGDKQIFLAGATEEEVYKAVKLPFIPAVLRENRGEIEAAVKGKLPKLVQLKDLRGDLHCHSTWSDGKMELEDMARAYRDAGLEYMAITDHSPAVAVAHGLTPERYELQWDEVDALNEEFAQEAKAKKAQPFVILKGTECDILPDGSMDLPDKVLAKMDIVVASVHSRFRLSEKEQTARVVKALAHPAIKILGHPSGRLVNQREPIALDMGKIIEAAIKHKVALEINSQPSRLDLFDYYAKLAKEKGAVFVIDGDAHHAHQIENLQFGVAVAQRGWLEKKDVLNTRSLQELLAFWK